MMERGVYFDAWFPRQHCYHPSLPARRLRMVDDLLDYRATVLVWSIAQLISSPPNSFGCRFLAFRRRFPAFEKSTSSVPAACRFRNCRRSCWRGSAAGERHPTQGATAP